MFDGGVKATVAWVAFVVALKFVGAFGATIGVACADVETIPGPTELTPRN